MTNIARLIRIGAVATPLLSMAVGQRRMKSIKRLEKLILNLRIWRDTHGQDLIEYALMAGFVAVAAAATMPHVSTSISKIFSKIESVLVKAGG